MRKIVIEGGTPLRGEIHVSGAKNAVLPLIAATLLADGQSVIDESPWLSDVDTMSQVLSCLGARVHFDQGSLSIDTSALCPIEAPCELAQKMRASFLIMGPILARFGQVRMSLPGGCAIGARPIDLHLKGFEALGAKIILGQGYIESQAPKLIGTRI